MLKPLLIQLVLDSTFFCVASTHAKSIFFMFLLFSRKQFFFYIDSTAAIVACLRFMCASMFLFSSART